MAENLKHSSVLFTDKDCSPLEFKLWPSVERRKLKPLIEHGGGNLTNKAVGKSIKLAPPDSTVRSAEYISTRYIHDCVKQNRLLDMSLYRMDKAGNRSTSSIHLDDEDLNHASFVMKTVARDRKGRKKFILAEDNAIIKYLMEERRYTELKGNAVWKDMEMLKITSHTHQSMKDRFRKTILPNIHQYVLPKGWVSALTGNTSDSRSSPGSTSSRIASRLASLSPKVFPKLSPRSSRSQQPLQSTPIKTKGCRNGGNSDQAEETMSSHQQLQSTPVRTRPCRNGGNKTQAEESMDHSDEDDFDKELYKLSVPVKGGMTTCENLSIIKPNSNKDMVMDSPVVVIDRLQGKTVEKKLESPVNRRVKNNRTTITSKENNSFQSDCEPTPPRKSQRNTNTNNSEVNMSNSTTTPVIKRETSAHKRKNISDEDTEDGDSSDATTASSSRSPAKKGPNSSPRKTTSQRKHKRSSNEESRDGGIGSGRTALTDFIMNSQEPENSQGSLSSADEGSNLGTDLEDCAGPSEVKKHCQIIKKLCGHFSLAPSEVLEALWANNGSLRNTVHWIHHGTDISGWPAWTEEDDKILESASTEDINTLRRKYGCEKVDQRAAFLEDSSFKD